jgi:hypothetical protein
MDVNLRQRIKNNYFNIFLPSLNLDDICKKIKEKEQKNTDLKISKICLFINGIFVFV